ncbi:hypothetical protein LCGC14_1700310 [marine sediment metagenome]|uniref:Uncharacterized protein n=1 Tax=marine sediment metagenome TaxID=412755 RepID=A0A0F9KI93_9ZZZZ
MGNGKYCTWFQDDDGIWQTDCNEGHIFETGSPFQNDFRFCPYCRKRIEIDYPATHSSRDGEKNERA